MGKNTESNKLLSILLKDRGSYEDMLDFIDTGKFAKWLGCEELTKGIIASYSNFVEKTQFTDKLCRREMDDFVRMITKIINDSYEYPELFISYSIVFRKMQKTSLETLLQNILSPDKDGRNPWIDIWTDRISVEDACSIYRFYIICACIKKFEISEQTNDSKRRTRRDIIEDEAIYRDDISQNDQSKSSVSDTQENEAVAQEESPEPEENRPVFKSDAEKALYQKFQSDTGYANDMKFLVYDFASYIFQAARERSNELKETLEHVMSGAVSAIILGDEEKEAIAKLVLKTARYWDMSTDMMKDPIIANLITRISESYQHVATELGMDMEDIQLLLKHATMNAFFVKGGYFDETREVFKRKERYGQVVINTGNAQDSTQESNNCVPEGQQAASTDNAAQEPVNIATDTRSNIMDEFNKFQAEVKAASQQRDDDILLYMLEPIYHSFRTLGFDDAISKVIVENKDSDKDGYNINYSVIKRELEVLAKYKHLPGVQGEATDLQYAHILNMFMGILSSVMKDNGFDDPEIKDIVNGISEYYYNKAADNSTVTDEEATATTNTGEDTSDEEDFMEVHDNDDYSAVNEFGAKLQKAVATYDDDIKLTVPEELYKMAEGIGLVDDTIHLIETVNDTKLFNLSQYKRSWEAIYEVIKVGLRQIMPEKTINTYEERIKHIISAILKGNGYDENGNRFAGYAISNNTPLTVNESVAPYSSVPTPTSPVMNRPADTLPVQEDFGVFAPDKAESIDLPGITITLNGEKRFLSNECYPYNMWRIHIIWMNDVNSGKIILPEKRKDKMTITINGHDVSNNAFAFMHDKNNIVYKVEPAE